MIFPVILRRKGHCTPCIVCSGGGRIFKGMVVKDRTLV